jgi:hypothetical protein
MSPTAALVRHFDSSPRVQLDLNCGDKDFNAPFKQYFAQSLKLEDGLRSVARQRDDALNHQPPGFVKMLDGSINFLSGKAGFFGNVFKYTMYPYIKDGLAAYYGRDNVALPNLTRAFVVDKA